MNASDVVAALRTHYGDAWALIEQVGDATGFSVRRHLDIVAMGLWPSRGMEVHGIEVKVDRQDFLKEIAQPAKAEAVASKCDRFFIAAPAGLVKAEQLHALAPAWGLYEVNEAPSGKRTVTVALGAEKLDPKPLDRMFIAAVLRRIRPASEELRSELEKTLRAEITAENDRKIETEVVRRGYRANEVLEAVAKFTETTGINILSDGYGGDREKIAKAVKFLVQEQDRWHSYRYQQTGIANTLRADAQKLIAMADGLDGIVEATGQLVPEKPPEIAAPEKRKTRKS